MAFPRQAAARVETLRNAILEHQYRYYVLDTPIVSDQEFDALLRELQRLETAYPDLVTTESPTQRVGGEPHDQFDKVFHPVPLLSLGNSFSLDELQNWRARLHRQLAGEALSRLTYVVEPKIDGLSIILHYEDGIFHLGATRGNGEVGENVTANLRTIPQIPLRLPANPQCALPVASRLQVRGEIYVTRQDFEEFNQSQETQGRQIYANPRNFAAGSLRQLNPKISADRPLQLWVFQLIGASSDAGIEPSQQAHLAYLRELGFPVSDHIQRFADERFEDLLAHVENMDQVRQTLPYEMDGLVIKIDSSELQERLGYTGKEPRWATAFKYEGAKSITRLKNIEVFVGRSGTVTPRATLEPVNIGGVMVEHATLHNFDYIQTLDLRIGDAVLVTRAGDVIPRVLKALPELRTGQEQVWSRPEVCPRCNTPLVQSEGEVAFKCTNRSCPGQLIRAVEHFVSRAALDIRSFGSRQAELFVELKMIQRLSDVYALPWNEIEQVKSYGEKRIRQLQDGLGAAKERPPARLLTALGIPFVGAQVAELIVAQFPNLLTLAHATADQLESVDGVGQEIAEAVVGHFAAPSNRHELYRLHLAGLDVGDSQASPAPYVEDSGLQGQVFVITGRLANHTRDQVTEMIKMRGGKVTGSVSSKTDFLLAGEAAGSKLQKARDLGIEVLSEDGFIQMLS